MPLDYILTVYHKIGIVGASTPNTSIVGQRTSFTSLLRIAGKEVTVYWDRAISPKFVSEMYWRLA